MTRPLASLPMYDWPEVSRATDALWAALRDALRLEGASAPDALARDATHWTEPGLALSQTCGMPFRQGLHARVTLVGAPDYCVEDCAPGFYRSALVVRADDPREAPPALAAARFAYNAGDSQSGWAALVEALGPLDPAAGLRTGSHRASVVAVAEGRADVATIDAVAWRLACAWEPAAGRLRVLAWTRPTPGLPYITAGGRDPAPYAAAAGAAITALDPASRRELGLAGFVAFRAADYLDAA